MEGKMTDKLSDKESSQKHISVKECREKIKSVTDPILRKAEKAKNKPEGRYFGLEDGYEKWDSYQPREFISSSIYSELSTRLRCHIRYNWDTNLWKVSYGRKLELGEQEALLVISRVIPEIYAPVRELGFSFIIKEEETRNISDGGIGILGRLQKLDGKKVGSLILTIDDVIDQHLSNYRIMKDSGK